MTEEKSAPLTAKVLGSPADDGGDESWRDYVKATGMKLQERDVAILRFLAKHRFASAELIQETFWKGASSRANAHVRRLRALRRVGLIKVLRGDRDVLLGYCLTRQGRDVLSFGGEAPGDPPPRAQYKTTYEHDERLSRIREILEASPLVSSYLAEHELRSRLARRLGRRLKVEERQKVPDGRFVLTMIDRTLRIAVEVELAQKSDKRYVEMATALALSDEVDSTFFFVRNAKIEEKVRQGIEAAKRKNPYLAPQFTARGFYFVLVEKFLAEGRDAIFSGQGKTFSLALLEVQHGRTGNAAETKPTIPKTAS